MLTALPAGLTLDDGRGGLPRLTAATAHCTAELYLHGAHLCRWQPRGQAQPVLWMSRESRFEAGAPIRGGVPICFPWFGPKAGDPKAPAHGVPRIHRWTLVHADAGADGALTVTCELASNEATRAVTPAEFTLRFTVRLRDTLSMTLAVENRGAAPLTFEEALHTYLAVADVRQVRVDGLAGATYLDKTDGMARKTQPATPIGITGETDRVYLNTQADVTVTDPGFRRRIRVAKTGSQTTVVWNPWIAKSQAMPDFGDDEWPGMICIETANAAENPITLPAGAAHQVSAIIAVEPIG